MIVIKANSLWGRVFTCIKNTHLKTGFDIKYIYINYIY